MRTATDLTVVRSVGATAVVSLNHPNRHNPISRAASEMLCEALRTADADPCVDAIVLTGGVGRSFCAGGDFNETLAMESEQEVEAWIDRTIGLYRCLLSVEKPLVSAIEGFAIGIGFQLALCTDWRVAEPDAQLIMWELEKGLACTLGASMLQHCLGRLWMTDLVYGCAPIGGQAALDLKLVNEISPPAGCLGAAIRAAERFAAYRATPFRRTKAHINSGMIGAIEAAASASRRAHAESFAGRNGDAHFRSVLRRPADADEVAVD